MSFSYCFIHFLQNCQFQEDIIMIRLWDSFDSNVKRFIQFRILL